MSVTSFSPFNKWKLWFHLWTKKSVCMNNSATPFHLIQISYQCVYVTCLCTTQGHILLTSKVWIPSFQQVWCHLHLPLQWRHFLIWPLCLNLMLMIWLLCLDYTWRSCQHYLAAAPNTALLFTNATTAWPTINTFKTWSLLFVGCIIFC